MNFQVTNIELNVGSIDVGRVTLSSLFIVGDADIIRMGSIYDTPPESLVIGPDLVPLTREE
ncbi:spore gernimation protein GerPD [Fictibacillus aquaticus]|uniref:Spore gernimation protein GerPD n=1 Tax=Fictibacillus aquaticus TaxID=2021314 RepID=A0A235F6D0_9BACL|nr:spore gernimation protein GerPD [Fictibacillus aquaticus]OYD56497.1 spore gernimation protein GerPD [Fictibacillus aquaticus]